MQKKKPTAKLSAPRQTELPPRPTPLPTKPTLIRDLVSPEEWDIFVLCILGDWNWQLTFAQLVVVAKREGPFYGFSTDSWATDRVEIELQHSVIRLKTAKELRIGRDNNTLLPPKPVT